jgi:hypothetical protein
VQFAAVLLGGGSDGVVRWGQDDNLRHSPRAAPVFNREHSSDHAPVWIELADAKAGSRAEGAAYKQ